MVHWKAHGKAIKVHHTRRVHLSKLIHDCLPTHELLNKFDSGKRTCSLCQHHCEDRDHIIRCPHSSRETWRLSFMQSLNTFHSTIHTSPILQHVLNKALAQWLDPQQPDEINPVLFHTNVGKLIRQQNLIGWRQIFNGCFSVEWARIQEARLLPKSPQPHEISPHRDSVATTAHRNNLDAMGSGVEAAEWRRPRTQHDRETRSRASCRRKPAEGNIRYSATHGAVHPTHVTY